MSNATQQLKAKQRREKFAQLLREMFQLNQPELDFGLYRIMHARKDDINRFIEQDLPRLTQEAFSDFASQDKAQIEQELIKARKAAEDAGFNADESPRVKDLEEQMRAGFDLAREEGEVYDALLTFFGRYYSEGDFISRRVYKDGTYAIPYQGEEVILHWANKDQYYIKSSTSLRDYTFRYNPHAQLGEDPKRVHFKLVDAKAGAKDNNKEQEDKKCVFILDVEKPFEFVDGEIDENGNSFQELQVRFVFRPATDNDWTDRAKSQVTEAAAKKPPVQEVLHGIAEERLLGENSHLPNVWKDVLKDSYIKNDGKTAAYSVLKGHLDKYCKGGVFDYFIHKDLKGFLSRELENYIKNELMQWRDVSTFKTDFSRLAPLLSKLDTVRDVGEKIISFLSQLENFQRKLWLKKKFVTETNYCITLDRVPQELFPAICENESQLEEWVKLFAIDEIKERPGTPGFSRPLTMEFLKSNQNLVLDTRFFTEKFKSELMATIEDFDGQCDGLLVHSENFQALNLLQERYRERVKCIYIDPPYNTGMDGFPYKDKYQRSSWLSMFQDRLLKSIPYLNDEGIFVCHIDEHEHLSLESLIKESFRKEGDLGKLVWDKRNPKGEVAGISMQHEYVHFASNNPQHLKERTEAFSRNKENAEKMQGKVKSLLRNSKGLVTEAVIHEYQKWLNENKNAFTGGELAYKYIDEQGLIYQPVSMAAPDKPETRSHRPLIHPSTGKPCPVPANGWRFVDEKMDELVAKNRIVFGKDEKTQPRNKYLLSENLIESVSSLYYMGGSDDSLMKGMGYSFDNPKPVKTAIYLLKIAARPKNSLVFDYFGGSGTAAHAVIELNKSDEGQRKYILTEMGEHFNTTIKPRIAKLMYSNKWKNGKPESRNTGISHCFKYIRLESYEDTLGNLTFNQPYDLFSKTSDDEARQAYVMNYMLDVETRESPSLLNIQQFVNPTEYKLNVRSASGDETVPVKVDLLETFNYLLGLEVEHIAAPMHFDAEIKVGEYGRKQAKVTHTPEGKWWFRTVYGKNRNGQCVLVVWRNLPSVIEAGDKIEKRAEALIIDNAVLDAVLIERLKIRLTEGLDDKIDVLYVNGDNNIAIPRDRKGNPMEQARIQLIEEDFKRLMFADTDTEL